MTAFGQEKVLFHRDNARVHTCAVSMAKFHELRYELLPNTPNSPDLAPSNYFLFPNVKKWLGGKRFYSDDEIISQTNTSRNIIFWKGYKNWRNVGRSV